jgi:hypothetical protein
MTKVVGFATIVIAVLLGGHTPATAWTPPIGIPAPTFGINEVAPAVPNPWTSEVPGFYYVNYQTGSNSRTYGTPAAPRKTIPSGIERIPAGSVVEVHGTYDFYHGSPYIIFAEGTASKPVFIRGVNVATRPLARQGWQIKGSYVIIENIEFGPLDATDPGKVSFIAPVSHAAIRHCDIHGNSRGGGMSVASFDTAVVDNVVIWNNTIHDNGDVRASFDQDIHGIAVSANVHHLWVVDNELARNSGDGIQINAGTSQATTHHIYVGRNVSHGNKQSGAWTKQAVDVIFSQNVFYNHRPSNSSAGAGAGYQYGPERVWFLFNHIYDCDYGFYLASTSQLGSGQVAYFVGNLIHNIHHSVSRVDGTPAGAYNPNSAWSSAGIMSAGGQKSYVVNNTIFDVDSAINIPAGATSFYIVNNILGKVTQPGGNHIFIEFSSAANISTMRHNLVEGSVRIRWASPVYDLLGFQRAFPGQGLNSVNADPLFRHPPSTDFRLQAVSPAVDAGVVDAVYSTFFTLYGIDIAKDIVGATRPRGARYDLGAYEFDSEPSTQPGPAQIPSPPTGLRVR